jgi:hypothetical protein
MNPAPAPPPPKSRQTDHQAATTHTKAPPENHRRGLFLHPRPHHQRRHRPQPERRRTAGPLTKDQYKAIAAHDKLRRVLAGAKIPAEVDTSLLPVITQFAEDERQRQGTVLDGAHVVTQIRNRLVHPTGDQERVYQRSGLLMEVWLLTRHYLVLLVLHSVGYRGMYRDLRKTSGWAFDRAPVPWAGQ